MPVFEELPNDDAFRVLKWFDRFALPHLGTRSASVEVLFQRLAQRTITEIDRLNKSDVRRIMGRNLEAHGDDIAGTYDSRRLFAGYVPHLRIGNVYKGRRYVGQLPASRRHIDLPPEHTLVHATIGGRLAPPAGWDDKLPYRPMTAKQYAVPFDQFQRSKCLYFLDPASSTEYIIPRTVIFRTFYASHTLLANAFTSGPWTETAHSLISESDFRSGLKTQVDPVTGSWDVVLTPHVPQEGLAHMLALFWFDPFARQCADRIYTSMLQDSDHGPDHIWFASAEIPLGSDVSSLALDVRGLELLPRMPHFRVGSEVPQHTFLVTSITSFPWPKRAPAVRWEKTNSGAKGEERTTDPRPQPYVGAQSSKHVGIDVTMTSSADASTNATELDATEDRVSIIGAPPLEKITKQSSIRYQGSQSSTRDEADTAIASAGNPSHGVEAQQPVRHNTIVRDTIMSFSGLLNAMAELTAQRDSPLAGYVVVQPEVSSQLAKTAGESCWNFLSAKQRQSGRWPRIGWRMVRVRGQRTPRTALVLRMALHGAEGYWIEIEPRSSGEGMRSPLLLGLFGDVQDILRKALETIVLQNGHWLQEPLEQVVAANGGGKVFCFRHRYSVQDGKVSWSVNALKEFLVHASSTAKT